MTISKGFLVKIGIKKSSIWGTAIDVNAADQGLPILSETLSAASNLLTDESLTGTADQDTGVTSSQIVAGTIEANLQYSSPVLSLLIAMAMGRADTPAVPLGLGAEKPYPYYGSFRLGDNLEGYFVSLSIDKQAGGVIHEYDSVKVNGFTITGAAGSFVTISFDLIARRLKTSGTTTTSLSAATVSVPKAFIRFEDFQFRSKAQSGVALNGDDQFYPTSFTLTLGNNLVGDMTSLNAPYVDEPIRDAARTVEGSFEIPKYEDTSRETQFLDGSVLKLDARARSSSQIIAPGGGPYYYEFSMYCPSIQISDAQRPISGFSKVPAPFSFVAKRIDSAPEGMSGGGSLDTLNNDESRGSITESLKIEIMNVEKDNPLS